MKHYNVHPSTRIDMSSIPANSFMKYDYETVDDKGEIYKQTAYIYTDHDNVAKYVGLNDGTYIIDNDTTILKPENSLLDGNNKAVIHIYDKKTNKFQYKIVDFVIYARTFTRLSSKYRKYKMTIVHEGDVGYIRLNDAHTQLIYNSDTIYADIKGARLHIARTYNNAQNEFVRTAYVADMAI